MSEKIQPTACPYCGQLVTVVIPDNENYSEAELNRMATLECSCPAGRQQRAIRDQIEEAQNNFSLLSTDGSQEMGFEPIGDSDVIQTLNEIIELAGYGKILDVTIKLQGLGVVKIKRTPEEIKVTRAVKVSTTLTANQKQ